MHCESILSVHKFIKVMLKQSGDKQIWGKNKNLEPGYV